MSDGFPKLIVSSIYVSAFSVNCSTCACVFNQQNRGWIYFIRSYHKEDPSELDERDRGSDPLCDYCLELKLKYLEQNGLHIGAQSWTPYKGYSEDNILTVDKLKNTYAKLKEEFKDDIIPLPKR